VTVPRITSPFELRRRLQRAAQTIEYVLVSVPIGLLGLVTVLLLVVGAALSVFGIGLPILLGASAFGAWIARLDRRAANRMLDTHLPPLPPRVPARGSPWRRSLSALSDRQLWRIAGLLAVKPLLAVGTLLAALAPIVLLAELLFLGLGGIAGIGDIDYVGPWRLDPVVGVVLLAMAVPAGILAIAVLDGLYTVLCTFTRALLAPRAAPGGPVREMLAESLGDRSLSIAYWLPDRQAFVDETGRQVLLPEAGSGRSWTAVERDGQPVAAIVHDAAMDAGPELVHAAATAAGLAIDNERLKADLRARVEELRVSRLRIVEAGDAARRRLERDLHDGAQQQLVGIALDLHLLKSRLGDADSVAMVDEVAQKLQLALGELRELARGIHPAILTDRGLGPALDALASRSRFPVDIAVTVGEDLPPAVAAAAYFVVAEALTNVAKYAQADEARVEVAERDGAIHVLVSDEGVGGATKRTGSGLHGLEDRVAALDGTLRLDSPPGGGTRLRARIPCDPRPGRAGGPAPRVLEEQGA
jgi:signal transduction histidine kinase